MDARRIVTFVVLAALLAMFALPGHLNGYLLRFFTLLFISATLAQAWNLIGGYAGYASFGNVAFFGAGAFACGYAFEAWHWQFPAALAFAALVGALYAFAFGVPLLRLRGHYFAIATLGMGIGTEQLVAQIKALGGGSGMTLPINNDPHFFYVASLALLIAAVLATLWIANSRLGYALAAVRENEEAAAVLGIDTTVVKIAAWTIAAAFTAAAGALFGYSQTFIDPPTAFDTNFNVQMIIMAMLGGAGTVVGPTIGAFVLQAVSEVIWRQAAASPWHTVVLGLVIVLVVIALPRGIMPFLGAGAGKWNLRELRRQLASSRV